MDVMKEEDVNTASSFNEGEAIGLKGDGPFVPAAFNVSKSEYEVQLTCVLSSISGIQVRF
jgi:hypothetical protein